MASLSHTVGRFSIRVRSKRLTPVLPVDGQISSFVYYRTEPFDFVVVSLPDRRRSCSLEHLGPWVLCGPSTEREEQEDRGREEGDRECWGRGE